MFSKAYQHFSQRAEEELAISLGGEWLLDNFHIVQRALHQVQEDMPLAFYRELPRLDISEYGGYPRIYHIAREVVHYVNSNLAIEQVKLAVETYQQATPLTMGELWALPTMLRIGILEDLAQVLVQLTVPAISGLRFSAKL